jgi:hypothetical protein
MKHIRQHIIAEFSLLFLLCSSPVTAALIFFTDTASFNNSSLLCLWSERIAVIIQSLSKLKQIKHPVLRGITTLTIPGRGVY